MDYTFLNQLKSAVSMRKSKRDQRKLHEATDRRAYRSSIELMDTRAMVARIIDVGIAIKISQNKFEGVLPKELVVYHTMEERQLKYVPELKVAALLMVGRLPQILYRYSFGIWLVQPEFNSLIEHLKDHAPFPMSGNDISPDGAMAAMAALSTQQEGGAYRQLEVIDGLTKKVADLCFEIAKRVWVTKRDEKVSHRSCWNTYETKMKEIQFTMNEAALHPDQTAPQARLMKQWKEATDITSKRRGRSASRGRSSRPGSRGRTPKARSMQPGPNKNGDEGEEEEDEEDQEEPEAGKEPAEKIPEPRTAPVGPPAKAPPKVSKTQK